LLELLQIQMAFESQSGDSSISFHTAVLKGGKKIRWLHLRNTA